MKKPPILSTTFPVWLKSRYTARELAATTDISTQAATRILNGAAKPSEDTLKALGLQIAYVELPK